MSITEMDTTEHINILHTMYAITYTHVGKFVYIGIEMESNVNVLVPCSRYLRSLVHIWFISRRQNQYI